MFLLDSLVRRKSVLLFLELSSHNTISSAAKESNISRQQATKLVKIWRNNNLIAKTVIRGHGYDYTAKGGKVRSHLSAMFLEGHNGK